MTGLTDELSEGRVFLGASVEKEGFKRALMAVAGPAEALQPWGWG